MMGIQRLVVQPDWCNFFPSKRIFFKNQQSRSSGWQFNSFPWERLKKEMCNCNCLNIGGCIPFIMCVIYIGHHRMTQMLDLSTVISFSPYVIKSHVFMWKHQNSLRIAVALLMWCCYWKICNYVGCCKYSFRGHRLSWEELIKLLTMQKPSTGIELLTEYIMRSP